MHKYTVIVEHDECGEFWWHVEATSAINAVLAASKRMRHDAEIGGRSQVRAVFRDWLENLIDNPKAIAINRMEPTV